MAKAVKTKPDTKGKLVGRIIIECYENTHELTTTYENKPPNHLYWIEALQEALIQLHLHKVEELQNSITKSISPMYKPKRNK